ncbi:hypothetical protein RND71_019305 [Anisodus tanguticus]|uniref:Reverse transcriptase domain-containing protein n=1 Tax=Anisodus tanguticus TaxID=243964 RepID=A0AAE1V8C9_9SOLA|nr:hypothetical protein RND71_019305 [Anisodus tanguticus]
MPQIKAEIEQLLKAGFIRTTKYVEWLANVVPVKKKNGKVRVCIDYRNLNLATHKDEYIMLIADMLVDSAAANGVLTFMDGYSGYNQISVAEDDIHKTAFRCPGALGIYEWVVMPFGLKNAGATYQRAMNTIFHDLIGKTMEEADDGTKRAVYYLSRMLNDVEIDIVRTASRLLTLKYVRQLLEKNDKGYIVATCRNPSGATGLLELKNKFPERLDIHPLDLTVESTIEDSAKSIRDKYGSLNLLINASGILSIPNVLQPETTLSKVQRSSLLLAYDINAVGPILVIKHMWPLLKAGGGSGTDKDFAIVANLSARVGSIGDNALGGWHSYRASKTALNQLTKNVSVEFARKKDPIICILLHPGTVDTDLSQPFQRNVPKEKLFTPEFSVQKLISIMNNTKRSDNGKFFAWDGQEIPW